MQMYPTSVAMLSVHTCPLARLGAWETGGMNVYVRELSRELGRRGIEVDVFTRRQDTGSADVVSFGPNARVIHLEAGPRRPVDKYEVLDYVPEFACGLQRFRGLSGKRYDLLHAHYWLSGRVALLMQERWDIPLIAMFHTLERLKSQAGHESERESQLRFEIERRTIAAADRVIAPTAVDQRDMLRQYGPSRGGTTVIPGGVDTQLFQPIPRRQARDQLNIGHGPVVLFVGRLQPLKGLDLLFSSFAHLVHHLGPRPNARLIVVGGPNRQAPLAADLRQMQRLQRQAVALGILSQVSFVGAVDQAELPTYYAAADVTVMPSSYESFGLVALESQACGTPVLATRVGGLASAVRDGETGVLVPWLQPELFAARLAELLDQPAVLRRMGAAAVVHAREFSWGSVADRVLAVYRQVGEGAAVARS